MGFSITTNMSVKYEFWNFEGKKLVSKKSIFHKILPIWDCESSAILKKCWRVPEHVFPKFSGRRFLVRFYHNLAKIRFFEILKEKNEFKKKFFHKILPILDCESSAILKNCCRVPRWSNSDILLNFREKKSLASSDI